MQDIRTISLENFKKEIHKLSKGTLIRLSEGIAEELARIGKKIPDEILFDLQRKDTAIDRELIVRKYLKPKDYAEYNRNRLNRKIKKIWNINKGD